MRISRTASALALSLAVGCTTAGSTWIAQPLTAEDEEEWSDDSEWNDESSPEHPPAIPPPPKRTALGRGRTVVIDESGRPQNAPPPAAATPAKLEGRVLGSFRNTYYDFPSEAEHKGASVPLKDSRCKTIAEVPRGFFEAVCVQGSGTLTRGSTVSFAKRDCECAETCPRTQQKICFDELDKTRFPWGRGATGNAITPLLTVAVDSDVIPLNTPIYIPEYEGLPRDADQSSTHDGCFIAQDRGMKIKGKHVDIFTGHETLTKLWNRLLPSNKGVTVVLDSPRCARANVEMADLKEPEKKPKRAD
jgi:3D (Asp-Asp-Asp) domain-containing protein